MDIEFPCTSFKPYTHGPYIQIVVHFCSILSLASSDQHQLTLQVTEIVKVVGRLTKLLVLDTKLEGDEIMDGVDCLGLNCGANLVAAILEDVSHLPIRGDLH